MYSGQGQYRWPDGSVYVGQWAENKMHGDGKYTDSAGREWHGKFYNGSGPGLISIE
jgi:hypothetical protein